MILFLLKRLLLGDILREFLVTMSVRLLTLFKRNKLNSLNRLEEELTKDRIRSRNRFCLREFKRSKKE